jgi:putative transcriptional regulator
MTEIKHHLTDALLMAYSAGTLPEAFNLVVATHVSMCDECRARLAAFDAVGGDVMETVDAVQMNQSSLAETMARIAKMDATPKRLAKQSDLPAPLHDYVGSLDDVKWRRVGGGVSQAIIKTSRTASVRLLRIPAGTKLPDHGHRGTELTLVLKGAFRDEEDRFGAGDIEVANEEMHHKPIAEDGEPCICLAATDAPLRFKSFLPRIAQPFLKI